MDMTISDNASRWLCSVLQQRIGGSLRLTRAIGDSDFVLQCPGAAGSIRFVRNARTPTATVPPSFKTWKVDVAGFSPPVSDHLIGPQFTAQKGPAFSKTADGFTVNYDLLFFLYWSFTRMEESQPTSLDKFGRFSARSSYAYQHGFLDRPIIDEWLFVVRQMAKSLWPSSEIFEPSFRLNPTHDVDFPSKYSYCSFRHFIRNVARDLILRKDFRSFLYGFYTRARSRFSSEIDPRDPFNTFSWLMDKSERHGLQSVFYFMSKGRHRLDPGYSPGNSAIRSLMREVHRRGHRIGLHPSFDCVDDQDLLNHEITTLRKIMAEENIEQEAVGARNHYYHSRYPHTFRQFEKASIAHDATMGFADHIGFRAGTCLPYPAFDHEHDRALNLEVRSLAVMEGTLYSREYMNLATWSERQAKVAEIAETCRKVGGTIDVLWHNSEVSSAEEKVFYEEIIKLSAKAAGNAQE